MIGHTPARAYLERELPPAALVYGPPSVGKWTLAVHLADHHRVHALDRWFVEFGFNIETARLISTFTSRAPVGAFKLVVARLDGAGRPALNAMLKTLEEPPPRVKFLFTCSGKPLPTILSRCMPFELGTLSPPELEQVYRKQGYTAVRARRAAQYANGNVERGYTADTADAHRTQVVTLIRALAVGDREAFNGLFASWDTSSSELLQTFFTECLTRRWNTFAETDAAGLHLDRRRLWHMVASLMRVRAARPRLGVRAALEPFLTHR